MKLPEAPAPLDAAARAFAGPRAGTVFAGRYEIQLARKITHRNVVRMHDLGEADGLRFLTMEYVPGTTLRDILDKKKAPIRRRRAGRRWARPTT